MSDDVYTFGAEQPVEVARPEKTVLDRLKERISEKVRRSDIFFEVKSRPGVYLRVSPNVTTNQLKSWRKNAGDGNKNGMDQLTFASYVVAATTNGFFLDGVDGDPATMADGETALTFTSPEIWRDALNANRAVPEGVRAFIGVDAYVEALAVAIMEAAGYGEEAVPEDPTKTSSTN